MEKIPFIEKMMRIANESGYRVQTLIVDRDVLDVSFVREKEDPKQIALGVMEEIDK